ncbi:MAG: metallophosphoesterase [Clostridia bacterium]|nr:metallophosphoesterase [Clostridia bacterium]
MFKTIETILPLSGITQEIRLLQITDLHLIHVDERDSDEVRAMAAQQAEWFPYADEVLESFRQYLRQEKPDCVVFTGDIIGFPSQKNIEVFREFLRQECPRYLYVFGNHDRMFTLDDLNEATCCRYTEQLKFAVHGDPELQVLDMDGVSLVGVDDSDNQISESQAIMLTRLMEQNKPCLLFMHIPLYLPGFGEEVTSRWGQPLMIGVPPEVKANMLPELIPTPVTTRFVQRLRERPGAIRGVFTGHVHFFDRTDPICGDCMQYVTPMTITGEPYGVGRLIRLIPTK